MYVGLSLADIRGRLNDSELDGGFVRLGRAIGWKLHAELHESQKIAVVL
jgi:hypothetical protein